jgi:monooxygenase
MPPEHLDVLIVGAGLSGISLAAHLRTARPGTTFAVLEARGAVGGTWDLFRYPGVRSDSDMFTLGYAFRPWPGPEAIVDGATVLDYLQETAREQEVQPRFHHRVTAAQWSSDTARWTVTVEHDAQEHTLTCGFLALCAGYYRYDQGHSPAIPGLDDFAGPVVHPQHWPADLEHAGRRVVVIGSGATAISLVPALAETAAHVTMVQRSPSWVTALPRRDHVVARLGRRLPRAAARLARLRNVLFQVGSFRLARQLPGPTRRLLLRRVTRSLPAGFDVARHFTPSYAPWDQRLCVAPDGDLFRAIRAGTVDVVTGAIAQVTPSGVTLSTGEHVPADVLVTATGLNLLGLGGVALTVDGRRVRLPETYVYKGMMLSGVPNLSLTVGYTNASWTLRADLVSAYVCRLLQHLDRTGCHSVTPVTPDLPPGQRRPMLELESGYVKRSLPGLPVQGPGVPWRVPQSYLRDRRVMLRGPVTDEVVFGRAVTGRSPEASTVGA